MMSLERLSSIESRLSTIGQDPWEVVKLADDEPAIRMSRADQPVLLLRVTRESEPAGKDDVEFIAHAPGDLRLLIDHVRGVRRCTLVELDAISSRVSNASRPPWKAFLKSKSGVGGDSVIWVSDKDEEPDLYLWIDSEPGPDVYFDFVAAARQDIPELLEDARSGHDD